MQIRKSKVQYFATVIFIFAGVLVWVLSSGDLATAGIYTDSAHGDSSIGVDRSGTTYATGDCAQCHETFDPAICGVYDTLLFAPLDGPDFCMECHTNIGSVQVGMPTRPAKIKSVFDKTYKHNVTGYSGLHKFLPEDETRTYLSANQHVECNDCHMPHTIGGINPSIPLVHPAGATTPDRTSDSNLIYNATFGSGVLQGVWGIDVSSWPGNWQRPTSFTELKPPTYPNGAQKEYQICFKCHSKYTDWGAGDAASSVARDFNLNNKSAHPVLVTQNNQTGSDLVPGTQRKGLGDGGVYGQMKAPWITNINNTTMYCSDCHGNDAEGSTDPVGVHGSDKPYMLRSWQGDNRHYWPEKPGGGYWTLDDVRLDTVVQGGTWEDYLFCAGCHVIKGYPYTVYYGFKNNVHPLKHADRGYACVNCHNRRVHGSDLGRLMGGIDKYGNSPDITFFNKKNQWSYTTADCKVVTTSPMGCYAPGQSHDGP